MVDLSFGERGVQRQRQFPRSEGFRHGKVDAGIEVPVCRKVVNRRVVDAGLNAILFHIFHKFSTVYFFWQKNRENVIR